MPRTVISGFPPRREGEACFLCISSDDKGDAREAAAPEGSSGPVEDLREANREEGTESHKTVTLWSRGCEGLMVSFYQKEIDSGQ